MASGYSITLVVGSGLPGHASIELNTPATQDAQATTTYAGMGPSVSNVPYTPRILGLNTIFDIVGVLQGESPVGLAQDPAHEYSYVNASEYSVKSYTFEISKEQYDAALSASTRYLQTNPNYNVFDESVCTDYALFILHAALPGTDLSQLSRIPTLLQGELAEASQNGDGSFTLLGGDGTTYHLDTGLPGFQPDANPPNFSPTQQQFNQLESGPFNYASGDVDSTGVAQEQVSLVRYGDGSAKLTSENGTVISFADGALANFAESNGVLTFSAPSAPAVPLLSVDTTTGYASFLGTYQVPAGSAVSVSASGSFAVNVFDAATNQHEISAYDISGVLQSQQDVFAAGNELLKYYDTQNTHPYTELDVSEDANKNITAAQITLDPNLVAAGGSIGDIFGSAIGRALAGNNQFVQLGVGTVAGYIGQQLGGQFSQSLLTNGANFSFANAFGNIGIGLAGAGAGSIASFLTAEIGVALGLHGYSAQLFDAALGGTFSSLASQAATIGLSNTMAQISWSAAAGTAEANVGAALGSILAQQILPAENKDGVVGGQLLGAIGSAIGISLTIGEGLGFALDTIIPGIGSLIGTILGTLIGDLFGGSSQHPSATFTVDPGSYLYVAAFQAVSTSDGGNRSIPEAMAGGVVNIVNAYLTAVGGVALGEMTQELIGYQTDNPSVPYIAEELSQNFYLIPHYQHAEDAVNTTALDLLHHTEAVGGDLLLKRAHQDSQYTDVVALSGDLQVAEDYERYLNNREAINALIAANAVATVPHAEHA
jgi:hypothetical protein